MLEGKLVVLRPIRFEDWEKTLLWRNDMLIKASTMSHPFPITADQEQAWYKEKLLSKANDFIPFSIIDKTNDELIGYMSLNTINWINRNCFWGAAIGEKENFGKGFGRDMCELILNYAFKTLNMRKVYAYVYANHPAMKTWLKLGAAIEGKLKGHYFNLGVYEDVNVLAWYNAYNV